MENNIQDNIKWGQSFNLAVELASRHPGMTWDDKEIKETILSWQKWFYEEIGKKPRVCESCGGTATKQDPIRGLLHEACRTSEFVYKKKQI